MSWSRVNRLRSSVGLRRLSVISRRRGISGMGERRRCSAADGRWCLVYQLVVLQRRHREQSKVHTACDVALEDGITYMPAPDGRPWLAPSLSSLPRTTVHPPRIAGEHPPTGFHLVI